jgi:membrane protein implicated in regulation of membrane protease activity
MFNILIGIIWQITLMAAPLALVIKNWDLLIVLVIIAGVTSYILKRNWYEKLERDEAAEQFSSV